MTDNRMKPYTVSQCCTAEWCRGYNEAVKKANEIIEDLDIKNTHLAECLAETEKKYSLAVAEREANVKGFTETINKAKAEAIKKFAERLKESKKQYEGTLAGWTFTMTELDNLVKEMVGDANEQEIQIY